jgi:hypothetical protein
MSASGQKRTYAVHKGVSASPPIADMDWSASRHALFFATPKLRPVGLQGTIRGTMVYWERRQAALSDVTKPTSTTACKEIRSFNLTAICEIMVSSASSTIAG